MVKLRSFERIKKSISSLCCSMRNNGCLPDDEAKLLETVHIKSIAKKGEKVQELDEADKDFYSGKEGFAEHIERRRELGGFEYEQDIKGNHKALNGLLDKNLVEETQKGIRTSEPNYHSINNFRLTNTQEKASECFPSLREFANAVSEYVGRDILPNRRALTDEIAFRVESESAIIYSGSPIVFSPFELRNPEKRYMHRVANAFRSKLTSSVFYIWNEQSIVDEIAALLKEQYASRDVLKREYYDHFLHYGTNCYMNIYYGDNRDYTNIKNSVPYVSANYIIFGDRDSDGSLSGGSLIDKNRPEELAGKIPIFGEYLNLPIDLTKVLMDTHEFDTLRKGLDKSPKLKRFDNTGDNAAEELVEVFFETAERKLANCS